MATPYSKSNLNLKSRNRGRPLPALNGLEGDMTTHLSRCLRIILVLLGIATVAAAQDLCKSNDLREQIQCLENIPIKGMSPSMLEIYERTLLRSYEQLVVSIQRQLNDGTISEAARNALNQEKAQTVNNIAVLRISLSQSD